MSTNFSALTTQQQALIENMDALLRKALVASRAALAEMRIYDLALNDATLQAAFSQLDLSQLIPTQTSLAGATAVPGTSYASFDKQFQSLLAAWDTPDLRAAHTAMVGAANIDGQP